MGKLEYILSKFLLLPWILWEFVCVCVCVCVCVGGGVLIPITIFHSTVQNPSGQRPKKAKQFRYFWTGVSGCFVYREKNSFHGRPIYEVIIG